MQNLLQRYCNTRLKRIGLLISVLGGLVLTVSFISWSSHDRWAKVLYVERHYSWIDEKTGDYLRKDSSQGYPGDSSYKYFLWDKDCFKNQTQNLSEGEREGRQGAWSILYEHDIRDFVRLRINLIYGNSAKRFEKLSPKEQRDIVLKERLGISHYKPKRQLELIDKCLRISTARYRETKTTMHSHLKYWISGYPISFWSGLFLMFCVFYIQPVANYTKDLLNWVNKP